MSCKIPKKRNFNSAFPYMTTVFFFGGGAGGEGQWFTPDNYIAGYRVDLSQVGLFSVQKVGFQMIATI